MINLNEQDRRINEAEKFFNLLYGNTAGEIYSYLWISPDKRTISFVHPVSDGEVRRSMAQRAIELNDRGCNVYHSVNLGTFAPRETQRFKSTDITLQSALIVDIDIKSDAHAHDNLVASLDEARNLLPFEPSIIIDSGYGLHGYYLFDSPMAVNDDNRKEVVHRNNLLLDVIRSRAGGKTIDGVGDLPRILRTPGTFNFKHSDNPRLCHIVEVNDVRYTPQDIDTKLAALSATTNIFAVSNSVGTANNTVNKQSHSKSGNQSLLWNDRERARAMLEVIPCDKVQRADWIAVGMILKKTGNPLSFWVEWSKKDAERFKPGECENLWQGFECDGKLTIATLHAMAKEFGFDEKSARLARITETIAPRPVLSDTVRAPLSGFFAANPNEHIATSTLSEIEEAINFARAAISAPDTFDFVQAANLGVQRQLGLLKFYVPDLFCRFIENYPKKLSLTKTELIANIDAAAKKIKDAQKNYNAEIQSKISRADHSARTEARSSVIEENLKLLNELHALPDTDKTIEIKAKMVALIRDSCDWYYDRYLTPVAIKSSAANGKLIFTFDPDFSDLVGYNEFTEYDAFLKSPIWDKDIKAGNVFADRDEGQLRLRLRERYTEFGNQNLIRDLVIDAANRRKFNPVKQYLENLPPWDGTPRAERFFVRQLGADDTEFTREVTLNWLTAAIARVYSPGCRYQLCPILFGEQGIGKTYSLERLGGAWYGTLSDSLDDSHALDALKEIWLVELKELRSMRRADAKSIKLFVDSFADTRREAYERRAKKIRRHSVLIGTVNEKEFLSDTTGNRRFPIIECHNKRGQIGAPLTDEYIGQVWAESLNRFFELFPDGVIDTSNDFKLRLSPATQLQVEEFAERHMREDGMDGEIKAFLEQTIPPHEVWDLLSREERRSFFTTYSITVEGGIETLKSRLTARKKYGLKDAQEKLSAAVASANKHEEYISETRYHAAHENLTFFGSVQREHICAGEIFGECFGNDKRKSMARITEILSHLDDWHLGKRIQHDRTYGDQKNTYYRDVQPTQPVEAIESPSTVDPDFGGVEIDPNDLPII